MNKQELESIIKDRDSKYESPEARARRIWDVIQASRDIITDWDIICFCNLYLGLASAQHTFLSQVVRHLNSLILGAHYNMPEDQLALDKKMKLFAGLPEDNNGKPNIQDVQRKSRDLVQEIRKRMESQGKSNTDNNK